MSSARISTLGERHPLLLDAVLAAATAVVSLALARQHPPGEWRLMDGLGVALTCLASLTLVARRRAPMAVLLGYGALWCAYVTAGYWPVVNSAGALLTLYTVASLRPPRVTLAAALLTAAIWVYAGLVGHSDAFLTILGQSIVWTGVVSWFGSRARLLAERGRRLERLTMLLRRDREERARRAVVNERVRIARELHDVVAHHMSVVSVQAGLARYVLYSDPRTSHAALDTVLDSSGEALGEMRRLLTVLRVDPEESEGDDPHGSAVGLDHLDDLVNRVRRAGVPVDVVVVGAPRHLPSGLDLCAYRVIQEGLTNVLKHAGRASVTVTLRYEVDRFVAQVVDDGGKTTSIVPEAADGQGLVGMRERAGLYGGSVVAGPCPAGGFEVVLILPVPQ
ncbi:signal transduction histidine kinase [Couchioplanes caeruleus]|uniref:histidine kinase n=1 Tax=Couchioplanes caeruleus TaxID=56438 RepID=A0A3N1GTK8_9ACTN|nr:signal transduction histidine kinase [Couchioplanes caeruleus]